ncbi:MAG: magnesium protoporphyrin IX methyltransferase [Cyanobacteria bacterium RI_101]|nr:magnesium protoporphyrin IX methyltransferase [Cyanobacteria bacterium RI_101]
MPSALDDKTIVKDYFNATGFDRWRRIYGDGEVNVVQRDIRAGHQQTVDAVLTWLKEDGNLGGLSICDAGCGVGSLSIPLAQAGALVYGSDISEKMVGEAQRRAEVAIPVGNRPAFMAQDLERLTGQYHTVICLDVLIHYPTEEIGPMIAHLASLAQRRLILSFAPKTLGLTLLKKVGEFFPGPSKATRAYQHPEERIVEELRNNGLEPRRRQMTSTRFYFSRLLEAVRK